MNNHDKAIVRELAMQYIELANAPSEKQKRDMWRAKNSFKMTEPLIYIRAYAWNEMPMSRLQTTDPVSRQIENFFRNELYRATFADDYIFEPWYTVNCTHKSGGWGVDYKRHFAGELDTLESYKIDYFLKDLADTGKLRAPFHAIDEDDTARNLEQVHGLIGDIIAVNLSRGPIYHNFSADLSTSLGHLRGIENIMLDMYENPEWLRHLLQFMSDGVLRTHDQAEAAGDIGLTFTYNQAMPYAEELPDPVPNVNGVKREQLWCFTAAQEYTLVSPEMHEEFLLRYQLPVMRKFGLVAYGCCEDLTNKIAMLRQIPNLRRIAVSPFADVKKCAEQIGTDYVISYRPSPADMVAYGFDESRIRKILKRDLEYLKGTFFDITLKDVETVQSDPDRIRNWVKLVREIIAETC
ncbi:MAG: hypothetical protein WCI51_10535 [Lentisphaerota bacterium]